MYPNRKGKILWNRVLLAGFTLIAVIWLLVLIFFNVFHKDKNKNGSNKPSVSASSSSIPDKTTNANYDYKTVDSTEIHTGELILVNNNVAYQSPDPTDLTNVLAYRDKLPAKNFYVKDNSVNVQKVVMDNLNNMINDFVAAKNDKSLMIISGFRNKDYQQKLYDADLKKNNATVSTLVAMPGYSEHQTGYAVDFGVYSNKKTVDYDGTGNFAWINENCYNYGFILRYPKDKTDKTGISNETWHFRYVGKPHSTIIKQKNYCYEEYIDSLKQYDFNKTHLAFTDSDNTKYDIYYVPAGDGKTKIPVPKNNQNYTISGNNVDGFIVTVKLAS